jgi:very-short-patch-repair endonuclease
LKGPEKSVTIGTYGQHRAKRLPPNLTPEDRLAAERLGSLLDYVEALVKLDEQVPTRLAQYKLPDGSQFILHQHEISGLPGIKCDFAEEDGPVWMRLQRLQRLAPPAIEPDLANWLGISNDPTKPPVFRDVLHKRVPEAECQSLIEAGEVRPTDAVPSIKKEKSDRPDQKFFDVMLRLEDRPAAREALEAYAAGPWAKWAEAEKPRRRSISVYQRVFEVAQRLLQSGGTEAIELVWGIGLSRWKHGAEFIDVPMIECGAEVEIAETGNADITVRPRLGISRVELRPFAKLATARFALAEDAARRCLRTLDHPDSEGISPFRPESYEPILKLCGNQLDPEGRYLPDHQPLAATEPVPEPAGDTLNVGDRYVLYARRRSNNSVLRDIEQLKGRVGNDEDEATKIEGATRTLVLGPGDGIDEDFKPLGNDSSDLDAIFSDSDDDLDRDPDHTQFFFPKAFNHEQVEIIRRLEKSDGLVVQGPPGTGKTHTIANIISHMLATGRRVLVVSHGETALRVIQDQLPDGVRDLTISVTKSERQGEKQVEKAVGVMLGVVNRIDQDRGRQGRLIKNLTEQIEANKVRLQRIDEHIAALAAPHMAAVPGFRETPYKIAQRVVEGRDRFDWFSDRPSKTHLDSGLTQADFDQLFAARNAVKSDLKYLGEQLPSPANLPDADTVLGWHQDLLAAQSLDAENASFQPLTRRVIARLGVERATELGQRLQALAAKTAALQQHDWAWLLAQGLLTGSDTAQRLHPIAATFAREAQATISARSQFLARPVELPKDLPPDKQMAQILDALIAGRNPFGLLAFGLRQHQAAVEAIRVAGSRPTSPEDWQHVRLFIGFCVEVASLSSRWETLRGELGAPAILSFDVISFSPLATVADTLESALSAVPAETKVLLKVIEDAIGDVMAAKAIMRHPSAMATFATAIARHVSSTRLAAVQANVGAAVTEFGQSECDLARYARQILAELIGKPSANVEKFTAIWRSLLAKIGYVRGHARQFQQIKEIGDAIARAGAPAWAERLKSEAVTENGDPAAPADWADAWAWAVLLGYLESIGRTGELARLHHERLDTEKALRDGFASLVKERTFYNLAAKMKGTAKAALQSFANIIHRMGTGKGQRDAMHRQNARSAMKGCYDAVPCWIMPTWRVSEQLPPELGSFDLVILDEASQSDARELPALLRGKKILVVGDDRQVSPSSAFLSIAEIARLRQNFLSEFPFRAEVEPGASLYDLARVMFPAKFVMLKEHFRCVEPIIHFSMQFYHEKLVPLRIPKPFERLDPPLIDIYVEDGKRRGKSKVNPPEADIIVAEIEKIVEAMPPAVAGEAGPPVRSIGVISLIGAEQALYIQKLLMETIGEAAMVRHRIVCGDSATMQGDERDIVFLSMVADSERKQAQTALQYQQRFNVALSRARDRLVLVRSVREEQLNPSDLKSRVITHFRAPMPDKGRVDGELIDLCQSPFERAVFTALTEKGYQVTPQVGSEGFSIDMVVEGEGGRRLAIECDGDQYHGPERWADDMRRQRILERVGWSFWRCFGSAYSLDPEGMLGDVTRTLTQMKIYPIEREAVGRGFTEHRIVRVEELISPVGQRADGSGDVVPFPDTHSEANQPLGPGDRVVIRYLDMEPSRPESYVISATGHDPLNGILGLSSPMGQALADASPDDELAANAGNGERPILFVSLERAAAAAAA